MISSATDVRTALERQSSESGSVAPSSSGDSASPAKPALARTLASPDFDGEPVPNFDRAVDFEVKPLADFNSTQVLPS